MKVDSKPTTGSSLYGSKPKPPTQQQQPDSTSSNPSKGFGLMKSIKDSISTSTATPTTSNKHQVESKKVVEINNKKNTGDLQKGMTGATPGKIST